MKTISRIAIGAAVVMLLAATLQPAEAACPDPRLLNNTGAYLVSNPNWGGAGAARSCQFGYGCYASESGGGPISANIAGVFWGFDATTGESASDPAIAAGVDNGGWVVSEWTKSRSADFGEIYYYAGFLTLNNDPVQYPYNSRAGNPANWSFPVDGCITDIGSDPSGIDDSECTCIMLTDQWNGLGYFMVDSAITDVGGDFQYNFATTDAANAPSMQMMPMPAPQVITSTRDLASGDVTMSVSVGDITGMAADYRDTGCDCGLGFLVYQQVVGRGVVPGDRSIAAWTQAVTPTGAQPVTPFGGGTRQLDLLVDCNPTLEQDIYLTTALVEPGGLIGGNVSGNSFRLECGANFAEPDRPDRDRGRSDDAPRGRGNNRGQRDR